MATKKDLTKEEKIKREFSRLKRIFKDLDKNKLQTVESLIKNAAFMAVSLEELQEIINEEGYTVEYQNGANQSGTKQSDAVKTHIAMTKNHAAIIKQDVYKRQELRRRSRPDRAYHLRGIPPFARQHSGASGSLVVDLSLIHI